jgi:hypothetical protein
VKKARKGAALKARRCYADSIVSVSAGSDRDIVMNQAHYFFVFPGREDGRHCAPKNKGGCVEGRDMFTDRPTIHLIANGEEVSTHYGIGLWIVRRNLEALVSSAVARNLPDSGSEITLRIPLTG